MHIVLLGYLLKKKKNKIQKFKETVDSVYIYQKEINKASFQHSITYDNFKDLPKRTVSDKVLHDKAMDIAKNPKYGYQHWLPSRVKFFWKKIYCYTCK